MQNLCSVGKRVPKLDAVDKATGRVKYIQDLKVPGMLYGKILYSKYAHAKIVKVDTSRAKELPGVLAVLTGEDVPEIRMGVYKDNLPLKKEKVCSFRDEVAAVAATTPEIAEEALNRTEVTYEPLPAVFDPEAAMQKDAPHPAAAAAAATNWPPTWLPATCRTPERREGRRPWVQAARTRMRRSTTRPSASRATP